MNRIFYAERDTTLYEKHPEQNTGIDEILELTKTASGSRLNGEIQANTYNTRFLIDFGTEINAIKSAQTAGDIPAFSNENSTSASVFLNIRATEASDLLQKNCYTFIVKESKLEKLKALAYWERMQIKEVINDVIEQYIENYENQNGKIKDIPKRR